MDLIQIGERAKTAKGCLEWLDICGAGCCKSFSIRGGPWDVKKDEWMKIPVNEDPGMAWYYKLHGAVLVRGHLIFRLQDFEVRGDVLIVNNRCELLTEDLRCAGYPDKRPFVCKDWPDHRSPKYRMPDNCLYGVKDNENKRSNQTETP